MPFHWENVLAYLLLVERLPMALGLLGQLSGATGGQGATQSFCVFVVMTTVCIGHKQSATLNKPILREKQKTTTLQQPTRG